MHIIKVLIVAGDMSTGGLENQLVHLLRKADKEKFQIDYTSTVEHCDYQDEIESLGGRCIYIRSTNGKHFIRYCRDLYKVIKSGEYDIVHSHELFHSGLVLSTARIAGVHARYAHAHSCNQDYGKNLIRKLYNVFMRFMILKNGTCFLACSSVAAEFLYGKRIFVNPRYHLIFNSVDAERFIKPLPSNNINEFALNGWTNVLQVGRFSDEKNYLFTCEIAKTLKERDCRIRILCVGNNGEEYVDLIQKKISEYGIEEYMILLGLRNDIDILMKKADVFILPSKYEGMPLTLIEAQASGLPCVVADTFSHEVDFNIGLIEWLNRFDSFVWADSIEQASRKKNVNMKLVENAIRVNGFDSQHFADKLCNLYNDSYLNN